MAEGHDCRANMRRTVSTATTTTTTQASFIPLAVLTEICYITKATNSLLLPFFFLIHIQKTSEISIQPIPQRNTTTFWKDKRNLIRISRKTTTQSHHKMKFSALTFIALAASSVYGYVDLETRATCWKSDMQAIKDRINHYNVFCQAFNMRYVLHYLPLFHCNNLLIRYRPNDASPLPTLTTAKLSGACACLLAQWNKQANPTSIASAPANTCVASDTNLIKKEAPKNFQSYCRWWNLAYVSSSPSLPLHIH
jgi:hypothetical protein